MEISLGRYLFERLKQLGVLTVFGLPGDFNLSLLDKIYEIDGMRWAGNANELNSAYAADGYLRVKGLGCLITTFGVGEMSALNGVGGAYAEHVGLVHVVGIPSITSHAKQLLLHHTLGNGDFTVFHRMSNNLSQTTAFISDINVAPAEIDRCLRAAYLHQRPVYVGLPVNLVDLNVLASLLDQPIDLSPRPNDPETQNEVLAEIRQLVAAATQPVIVVDACTSRLHCRSQAETLSHVTGFPLYVSAMGKSGVSESHPQFAGVYAGTLSDSTVKEYIDSADLVLLIGTLLSEFSTGYFLYSYKTRNVVEFHADYVRIGPATYPGVHMKQVLEGLIACHSRVGLTPAMPAPAPVPPLFSQFIPTDTLSHKYLWLRVSSWFQEGDIIITETGTSAFGFLLAFLPDNCLGMSQILYGSIGYALGATLGAVMAAQEIDPTKRVVVFTGDGSLQATVQEISTMVKWETTPYIFVLNNEGSTVDRLIHGATAAYNDIQPWNILGLLPLFNAKSYDALRVTTVDELDGLLVDPAFNINNRIRMVEVMLPRLDAPSALRNQWD